MACQMTRKRFSYSLLATFTGWQLLLINGPGRHAMQGTLELNGWTCSQQRKENDRGEKKKEKEQASRSRFSVPH